MDKKTKKKFVMLAAAGMLVGYGVPAVSAQSNVASDVDAGLQKARAEQRLSVQDIDALSAVDTVEDETVGLY